MIAALIKYRYAIAIVATLIAFAGGWLYIQHLKREITSVSAERDEYAQANESQAEALRILSEASARQLAALERNAAEERERAKKHSQILQDIGSSNEEIKCPVPDFVRGAFERM